MVVHKIRHAIGHVRHAAGHVARHAARHPAAKHLSRLDLVAVAAVAIVALSALYSFWQISDAMASLGSFTANFTYNGTDYIPTPKGINVTLIEVPDCPLCYGFEDVLGALNTTGANITFERVPMASAKAQQLIGMYNITTLPALYVTGDTNRTAALASIFGAVLQEDGFFMEASAPPYYSVADRKLLGIVDVIVLNDSSCANCSLVWQIPDQLAMIKVAVGNASIIEYNSTEGMRLVQKYNITHVPVMLMSNDIAYYTDLMPSIEPITTQQADGWFLMQHLAPYRELSTGKVRGLVDVIYLTDVNCTACYNVSVHDQALKGLGMVIANKTFYDISDANGSALVRRYNVTAAPTMLLSPEAQVYPNLMEMWPTVGTVADDSWLVFRATDLVGTYHNLANNTIVNATAGE